MLKKRLGQHFLLDPKIARKEVNEAGVRGKQVAEIGAGDGRLTALLLEEKPSSLTAIEKDPLFAALLRQRFPEIEVWEGDALDYSFSEEIVVGNLPFNISGPIISKLAQEGTKKAVFILQWEFAKRLCAPPGKLSRISIIAQRHFAVGILERIPPSAFFPRPKVWGALVVLRRKRRMEPEFGKFARLLFQHRNKKVEKAFPWAAGDALGAKRPRHLTPGEIEELFWRWKEVESS